MTEDTVAQIRHASRQLVRELHLLDGRHCIEGYSYSECHLVTELDQLGEATASELADILVLEKSTISRLVNGLIERNHVTTRVDSADARRKMLSLTPKGQAGARAVHRFAQDQVGGALNFVDIQEQAAVAAGLQAYSSALRYARLSEGFEIRLIQPADNPAVAAIIRDVMTEYGAVGEGYSIEDPEVDDMHSAYPAPRARFWVIEKAGDIQGCGGFAPLENGPADTCELRKMYFRPSLRGRGLGTRLMVLCLHEAASAGFRHCYLETLASMDGARKLYGKHGFQFLTGPMGNTGHTGCNTWMARPLEPVTSQKNQGTIEQSC